MDHTGVPQSNGTLEYLHSAKKHAETYELFALSRNDCWIENYDLGFFYGPESVRRFFVEFHENMDGEDIRGSFCEHSLTTEVIVVADDLRTAKACWMSPGCETRREPGTGKLTSYWVWVKYAVDFIEENGTWKFWHFTIFSEVLALHDFFGFLQRLLYIMGGYGIYYSGNAGYARTGQQAGHGFSLYEPNRAAALAGSSHTI